jgi:hypothetical protein
MIVTAEEREERDEMTQESSGPGRREEGVGRERARDGERWRNGEENI